MFKVYFAPMELSIWPQMPFYHNAAANAAFIKTWVERNFDNVKKIGKQKPTCLLEASTKRGQKRHYFALPLSSPVV